MAIYRLIISLFIVFYSSASFALIPKSANYTISGFGSNSNAQSLCSAYSASQNGDRANVVGSTCEYKRSYAVSFSVTYSCPSNSSPSGSQCICNSGYEEKNGQCEAPDECDGLEETCHTAKGQTSYFEMQGVPGAGFSSSKACLPNPKYPKCSKGCTIESSIYVGYASNVDGKYYYGGEGKITGTVCSGSVGGNGEEDVVEAEPPSTKCKPGEFEGWAHDKLVCIPPKSKESTLEYEVSQNGDGTNTEKISTVKCENGVCTIKTEISIKDGSDEPRGTTTTETKISEAEFCQKNPGNIVCRTPGSGTGTGTALALALVVAQVTALAAEQVQVLVTALAAEQVQVLVTALVAEQVKALVKARVKARVKEKALLVAHAPAVSHVKVMPLSAPWQKNSTALTVNSSAQWMQIP